MYSEYATDSSHIFLHRRFKKCILNVYIYSSSKSLESSAKVSESCGKSCSFTVSFECGHLLIMRVRKIHLRWNVVSSGYIYIYISIWVKRVYYNTFNGTHWAQKNLSKVKVHRSQVKKIWYHLQLNTSHSMHETSSTFSTINSVYFNVKCNACLLRSFN